MTGRWAGGSVPLTKVVVVHHGIGRPQPGPLLGEVVAELQKRRVFFQHAHDLHFHLVAQGLALWSRKNNGHTIPFVQDLDLSYPAGTLRGGVWDFNPSPSKSRK